MALKTSLVIAGDSSSAVAAADALGDALNRDAASANAMAAAYAKADKAIDQLASAQVIAKTETTAAKAAFDAGEITLKDYTARLLETKSALSLIEAQHRTAITGLKQFQSANDAGTVSLAQARAGAVNLGRQVQDVGVMLSQPGVSLGSIISLQGGQIADAVAQMGGRFAGLGRILAGPLGTAIFLATGLGLNLAQSMWESSKAAAENAAELKKVELASSGLSDAQSVLGEMFDLTSGKIKSQNELLRLNAQLQAINLRNEADTARAAAEKARDGVGGSAFSYFTAGGLGEVGDISVSQEIATSQQRIQKAIDGVIKGQLDGGAAIKAVAERDLKTLNITITEFRKAVTDAVTARAKGATADAIDASLKNGLLDPSLRRTSTRTPRQDRTLGEFGEDTAKKLANIRDQYSDLPGTVEKANKSLRELDDIASDLERRKPPGYKGLISDAQALKPLIEASLLKPFNDYVEKSREAVEIDMLLLAGKDDQADALRVVLSLQRNQIPLSEAQLAKVVDIVSAERRRAMVLRDQRALIQGNIRAVQDFRGALEDSVADGLRGRFSLDRVLSSLGNSYLNITSQKIVERMFGGALRSIEEQARTGKMDAAVTVMSTAMGKGSSAVESFADTIAAVNLRMRGFDLGAARTGAQGMAASIAGASFPWASNDNGPDIVVTGKSKSIADGDAGNVIISLADMMAERFGVNLDKLGDGLKSLISKTGVDLNRIYGGSFKDLFGKLEKALPDALAGAFVGSSASRIVLGDKGIGGQIGSAIGGALGGKAGENLLGGAMEKVFKGLGDFAGPLGSIAGGLIGGLVGGLFNKAKTGGASVGVTDGGLAGVTGTGGNNSTLKGQANSIGGTIAQGLTQIAEQLNATIGNFSVAIGQRNDYYRVSASGSIANATTKHPGSDVIYDGQDLAQATSIAIANAIADGAIQGVSSRVAAGLRSSTDIDQALREGIKIQNLEVALGGVGAAIEQEFRAFEVTAKDRLRIAQTYGFSIVEVEAQNAKDRLAISKRLLQEQVGSLQSLLDEMATGSLYEGSAVDQRTKLLDQIGKTKAQADAGVEGSADTLAKQLEQLNTLSKTVFGSTGGFAADQQLIQDLARDTIAKANQRVNDAQKASDPALKETNAQLDENNDQNARMLSELNEIRQYLKGMAATGGSTDNSALRDAARYG